MSNVLDEMPPSECACARGGVGAAQTALYVHALKGDLLYKNFAV